MHWRCYPKSCHYTNFFACIPYVLLGNLRILSLNCIYLIHVGFIFVYSKKYSSNFIRTLFFYIFSLPTMFPEGIIFIPLYVLSIFVTSIWIYVCRLMSGLLFLLNGFMFQFLCQHHAVLIITAFQHALKSSIRRPPAWASCSRLPWLLGLYCDCLGILGLPFLFCNEGRCYVGKDCIESVDCFT